MDIFNLITLLGGLAFFLYGMHVMSQGLERLAGGRLEGLIKKMTDSPFKSLLLGAGITIAMQSSSAVTVMLVGLVNSGIMDISGTVGVIMGSNVGTTLTTWLLALVGVETDVVILKLLKPENFSLIFAFIGALLMFSKQSKRRDMGYIFIGFAVLMYGMKFMANAVSPLADSPQFTSILTAFDNPILGLLVGALFTAAIQSSAASVGVLQSLALTGLISYKVAIPIVMGQNIGTCITSVISSIGVSRNAKKVAAIHISFNLIGATVLMILFYGSYAVFRWPFFNESVGSVQIALIHTVFNLATTVILFPFSKQLVKLADVLLAKNEAENEKTNKAVLLDTRLMNTPTVAIAELEVYTKKMAMISKDTLLDSLKLFDNNDKALKETIIQNEDILDFYEDELGTYLVQLSAKKIAERDSMKVSKMLHTISDFERISDHAVNILKITEKFHQEGQQFSETAKGELNVLMKALTETIEMAVNSFVEEDAILANKVEPLRAVVDRLTAEMKEMHVQRLQKGECSLEVGISLTDFLANAQRVAAHCSNVAVSVIETERKSYDAHKYINEVQASTKEFSENLEGYAGKYKV